jgi:hypothetical protein
MALVADQTDLDLVVKPCELTPEIVAEIQQAIAERRQRAVDQESKARALRLIDERLRAQR